MRAFVADVLCWTAGLTLLLLPLTPNPDRSIAAAALAALIALAVRR